ncbi:hypothetical protein ACFU8Q_31450 [Streptomyces sp. NPDC057543]|uniref:hypothetical protein n=1 Tax=Streptomyces sp. NPDC057543 TaxID=3346163 RepID=UPI0036B754AA
MNIDPLLEALGLQENSARALAGDLRAQIAELQGRLREAETHLEPLAITRNTVTALADRLPAQATSPDLPEHPDYPRILAVLNETTGPLRARDACEALNHELLPKNIEGTRAKPGWQGQAGEGFAVTDFGIDRDARTVTCPNGRAPSRKQSTASRRAAPLPRTRQDLVTALLHGGRDELRPLGRLAHRHPVRPDPHLTLRNPPPPDSSSGADRAAEAGRDPYGATGSEPTRVCQ